MLSIFGRLTLGVKIPEDVDDGHGNTARTYPTAAVDLPGCDMQPGNTLEATDHRDAKSVDYTWFGPASADVPDDAVIVYDGREFEIVGRVRLFVDELGIESYKTALVRQWEG